MYKLLVALNSMPRYKTKDCRSKSGIGNVKDRDLYVMGFHMWVGLKSSLGPYGRQFLDYPCGFVATLVFEKYFINLRYKRSKSE